jgi:hypothetical protein
MAVVLQRGPSGQARPGGRRLVWIYGPGPDLLIALCWVPLFVFGHVLSVRHGIHNDDLLRRVLAATFLVSFLHQPLTFPLVYGDRRQFQLHRRLFVWAPIVTVAVVSGLLASHLWLLIPIAGLWNTWHTMQQRYGLTRIYARKSGYGSAALDRWVLYSWLVAAALVVAANPATPGLIERVGLDGINARAVRLLTDARPVALALLVPVGLIAVAFTVAIVVQERDQAVGMAETGATINPARWVYQASSLLLIASIAIDPAAGFIAYVGAHAIEYFVIVYKTTEKRYGADSDGASLLGRAAHTVGGRLGLLAGVSGLALLAHARLHGTTFNGVLYTVGALHFLYDGVIWKLRKPAVAADFAIRLPSRT